MSVTLPDLYGHSKNGKTKKWTIRVVSNEDGTASMITHNGYIDGKMAKNERVIKTGKNLGKSNATTSYEQAVQEAQKKHEDKKAKEGYSENVDHISTPVYPMLAQKYDETKSRKQNIVFPCFVQPKLDGYRCMVHKEGANIVFKSRVGKQFKTMEHLRRSVAKFYEELEKKCVNTDALYLDGELYSDELPFEEISGIIRVEKNSDEEKERKIHYHLYDLYDANNPQLSYQERNAILQKPKKKIANIDVVTTEVCATNDEVKTFHGKYVGQGYEGVMLRNYLGQYLLKSRSYDLQKYKEFEDAEFPITGFKEAAGEDKGTIIWECSYNKPDGTKGQFSVRPRGSREHRAGWFNMSMDNFGQFRNKPLTVRYQELGPDGCPRFPVGIDVRIDI